MSIPSPAQELTDLTTLKLVANGKDVSQLYAVLAVEIEKALFRVARARVTLRDGSVADEDFAVSAGDDFAPGSELEIEAGYHEQTWTVFKGVVWGQRLRVQGRDTSVLVVECRDKAAKATVRRRFASFSDQSDSEVIRTCLGDYGLTVQTPGAGAKVPLLTQWDATDWDFAMIRAQVNGWTAFAEDGRVIVAAPDPRSDAHLEVTFGKDTLDFDVRLDVLSQIPSAEASAWDPEGQSVARVSASTGDRNPLGSDKSSALAAQVGPDSKLVRTAGEVRVQELKGVADAAVIWAELGKVTGSIRFQGSSLMHPGSMLSLKGLGQRFVGKGFVGGVRHDIRDGVWTTEVRLGVDPEWFAGLREISGPPAAALIAPIGGLQQGIVTAITQDPQQAFRVQVKMPLLGTDGQAVWARLANFHASNRFGDFFYPEVGDEVVLGFMNQDPRFPVILGFLYSKARPPAFEPDDQNTFKAVVTRSGLKVVFDEVKKSILIRTPAGNQGVFSDDAKSIEFTDQTGNTVKLTTSGITLDSPGSIAITATGAVTVKSKSDQVSVTGTQGVSVKGLKVSVSADMEFSASGNARASVSSSGETSIQGTMVMIN